MIGGKHVSEKVIRVLLPFLLFQKPTSQPRPGLTVHLWAHIDFPVRGDSSRCRTGLPIVAFLKR